MSTKTLAGILMMLVAGCSGPQASQEIEDEPIVPQEPPFKEVSTDGINFSNLQLAEGLTYELIFSEGDTVVTYDGMRAPAKGYHDCIVYMPIEGSSSHGYLYVGHETRGFNDVLGHGGGATVFELSKPGPEWRMQSDLRSVDFSGVGGTLNNCGGKLSAHGTILSAEEMCPGSNAELYPFFRTLPSLTKDPDFKTSDSWLRSIL